LGEPTRFRSSAGQRRASVTVTGDDESFGSCESREMDRCIAFLDMNLSLEENWSVRDEFKQTNELVHESRECDANAADQRFRG
jgi:hypothetical protein